MALEPIPVSRPVFSCVASHRINNCDLLSEQGCAVGYDAGTIGRWERMAITTRSRGRTKQTIRRAKETLLATRGLP